MDALCTHMCVCVRVCCSHSDQQRDPEHPCADELEQLQKKKKIKQLRARLVGWDGDIPPYVVQQSLSKMLCVPLSPFWPKLDGGGILTTAGACCGQHTANAGAAACCSVPVMLCKLQA